MVGDTSQQCILPLSQESIYASHAMIVEVRTADLFGSWMVALSVRVNLIEKWIR